MRSTCSATRPPTCWPRPCGGSIPASRSRSARRSRTASTTTSSSRADQRGRSRGDRGRDAARARRGPRLGARGDLRRRGAARASRPRASRTRSSSSTPPRARSRCTRRATSPISAAGPHLQNSAPIKAFKLTVARRRLLARRRAEHAADADLRHRLLHADGSRRVPRAARAGAGARPPQARPAARPLPPRRALARLAVLASEGDGDLQRARGSAPARERAPRLPRGEDAADLRQGALGHLRPLGEVPREHVPDPRATRRAARRRSSR